MDVERKGQRLVLERNLKLVVISHILGKAAVLLQGPPHGMQGPSPPSRARQMSKLASRNM